MDRSQSFDTGVTVEKVTEEAADRFSRIALGLHQRDEEPAETAHFIMQLVFCLFAEDIKLLLDRNERPTWLRNAHAALDRAVWDAYGWPEDEVPGEVEEDVILSRLLALNGERGESA